MSIFLALIFALGFLAGSGATVLWTQRLEIRRWERERTLWAAGGPLVLEHLRQEWRQRR